MSGPVRQDSLIPFIDPRIPDALTSGQDKGGSSPSPDGILSSIAPPISLAAISAICSHFDVCENIQTFFPQHLRINDFIDLTAWEFLLLNKWENSDEMTNFNL